MAQVVFMLSIELMQVTYGDRRSFVVNVSSCCLTLNGKDILKRYLELQHILY